MGLKLNFQKWSALGVYVLFIQLALFSSSSQKTITLKDIYKTGKIAFGPVMKIDKESLPINIPLKGINSICRFHDRLYILDTYSSNIKVFNTDGRFVKVFGKEGRSESELNNPYCMNILDGQLVVWENPNPRFSIFNSEGKFKYTLQPFKKAYIEKFAALGNGSLIIERFIGGTVLDDIYKMFLIELYSKNFKLIKVLYQKQILYFRIIRTPDKDSKYIPLPFQPEVSWHILPGNNGMNSNKVVIGFSDSYEIDIIDTESGKSQKFQHPYSPVKVTDVDRELYLNSITRHDKEKNVTVQGADSFMRDNITFPEYKPVFKELIVDYEGNILVFSYTVSDNGKYRYTASEFDAFDAGGQFINHVKITNDTEIPIWRLYSERNHIFWGQISGTGTPVGIIKYEVK